MDWSKIKQMAEGRFAISLQGRLTINLTRYRRSSADQLYELWFSFDGMKVCGVSDGRFYNAVYDHKTGARSDREEAERITPSGWMSKQLLIDSLNLSIDDLLRHESPVVRALAVVDARFGERRLKTLDVTNEHAIVADMARIRGRVEGVRLAGDPAS